MCHEPSTPSTHWNKNTYIIYLFNCVIVTRGKHARMCNDALMSFIFVLFSFILFMRTTTSHPVKSQFLNIIIYVRNRIRKHLSPFTKSPNEKYGIFSIAIIIILLDLVRYFDRWTFTVPIYYTAVDRFYLLPYRNTYIIYIWIKQCPEHCCAGFWPEAFRVASLTDVKSLAYYCVLFF